MGNGVRFTPAVWNHDGKERCEEVLAVPGEARLKGCALHLALRRGVVAHCRRPTGLAPRKHEVIETHADFVANLMVP